MSNDKKNINYTNNDGAKYRYSSSRGQNAAKEEKQDKTSKIKEALTKRSVFWKTNRAFAIFVLVAVIILSSVWSIHRAVSRRSSLVEEYYVEEGVRTDLTKMVSAANSLASLNEALDTESPHNAECRALADEIDKTIDSPFWKDTGLAKKLRNKAEDVYNDIIHNSTASTDDVANAASLSEELENGYRDLGNCAHFAEASAEYNRVISKFPVSILSKKEAPVFERAASQSTDDQSAASVISNVINSAVENVHEKLSGLSAFQIIGIIVIVIMIIRYFAGRIKEDRKN